MSDAVEQVREADRIFGSKEYTSSTAYQQWLKVKALIDSLQAELRKAQTRLNTLEEALRKPDDNPENYGYHEIDYPADFLDGFGAGIEAFARAAIASATQGEAE